MPRRLFTEAEYLTIERASDFKSEYLDGQIYAMAGAGRVHVRIVQNITGSLYNQFRGRPCEHYSSEMRVRVADSGLYAYPDVAALCGEPRMLDDNGDVLLNPQLIVEVLSPSTASYDQGEKGDRYRQLESLTDYLLVEQSRIFIRHWSRGHERRWMGQEYDQSTDRVRVESLGIEFNVAEIYERVVFPPPAAASSIHIIR